MLMETWSSSKDRVAADVNRHNNNNNNNGGVGSWVQTQELSAFRNAFSPLDQNLTKPLKKRWVYEIHEDKSS
ncbi:unnamed protein product [Linum tenue]|uniref:Uncharacterized protein n=1 Tax=Linum tenue TaxID=586396 RepID=A0AAV0M097_9ROSI|nr:unnamed protein product [Linum tenue]